MIVSRVLSHVVEHLKTRVRIGGVIDLVTVVLHKQSGVLE
jgi:hypothetical protein